jgi:hypothetical protein
LNSTFHHNLWACNSGRNPSVGMYGDFTFVNNVLFNWVHRSLDGGDHQSYFNVINNYYKPGPATPNGNPISYRILKPESQRSKTVFDNFGKAYVDGNVVEGNDKVTKDNWAGGVQPDSRASVDQVLPSIKVNEPFKHAPLKIVSAKEAYQEVLAQAGATLPRRDAVDQRVIQSVRSGTVTAKVTPALAEELKDVRFSEEVIGKINTLVDKGIITSPQDVGGYPQYQGEPYADADRDGMPDAWEQEHGLNPSDPSDASTDISGDGYSNIEKYLNGMEPAKKVDWTDLTNNVDPRAAGKS